MRYPTSLRGENPVVKRTASLELLKSQRNWAFVFYHYPILYLIQPVLLLLSPLLSTSILVN